MRLWVLTRFGAVWRFEDVAEYEEEHGALVFSDATGDMSKIEMHSVSAYTTSEAVAQEFGLRSQAMKDKFDETMKRIREEIALEELAAEARTGKRR